MALIKKLLLLFLPALLFLAACSQDTDLNPIQSSRLNNSGRGIDTYSATSSPSSPPLVCQEGEVNEDGTCRVAASLKPTSKATIKPTQSPVKASIIPTSPSSTISPVANNQTVKTFVITGENFSFFMNGEKNPTLTVKKGNTVRIDFSSTSGFHDWVVDQFNAATSRVSTGASSSVEFVADVAGEFEYYCSVGQHRANGMKGKLVVN